MSAFCYMPLKTQLLRERSHRSWPGLLRLCHDVLESKREPPRAPGSEQREPGHTWEPYSKHQLLGRVMLRKWLWGFPCGSEGKVSATQETWVQSLGWEDPLEEGMATHSSILAWRIPMDRGAWWATVQRVAESDTTEQLTLSRLENSRPFVLGAHSRRRNSQLVWG